MFLYDHPHETRRDEVEFKNGMILDRYSAPVLSEHGENFGRIWTFRDITERKQMEFNLTLNEEKFRAAFNVSSISIMITDLETGICISANPSFVTMSGYAEEEVVGYPSSKINIWEKEEDRVEYFDELKKTGSVKNKEQRFRIKSGEIRHGILSAKVVKVWNTSIAISFTHDITDIRNATEALKESEKRAWESELLAREQSITDDLTRLYNTRYFYDQITMETGRSNRYGQPLSIALLDIDNFKSFNDTYGHIDGNRVLIQFGEIVKRILRHTDSSYRFGGEEFIIIFPATTGKNAYTIAEKIRIEFQKSTITTSLCEKISATVSIGVAEYIQKEDINEFIKRADKLMYKAKHEGKNKVCF